MTPLVLPKWPRRRPVLKLVLMVATVTNNCAIFNVGSGTYHWSSPCAIPDDKLDMTRKNAL